MHAGRPTIAHTIENRQISSSSLLAAEDGLEDEWRKNIRPIVGHVVHKPHSARADQVLLVLVGYSYLLARAVCAGTSGIRGQGQR